MKITRVILFLFCLSIGLLSCKENSTSSGNTGLYTISGTIKYKKSLTIPQNAKLIVIWEVSAGSPDYVYAFGEGSINTFTNTFILTFNQVPPDEALNFGLGIGYIILSTDTSIKDNTKLTSNVLDSTTMFGAISDRAIIYVKGDPQTAPFGRTWTKDFKTGFNFGKGVYNTVGFDDFAPADTNVIELWISNDGKDFIFPNWT